MKELQLRPPRNSFRRKTQKTGGVISTREIVELPLNGRDVVALATMVPGVRYGGKSFTTSCADGKHSSVQGLGHRDDQTAFKVDGVFERCLR